jgi:hypothetical protein
MSLVPAHLPGPVSVYIPPPLVPTILSTSLPPSSSSSIPFVSPLNSHVPSIPPSVSLPTMPQTLLLTVPSLYTTPVPPPSSPLPRLSGLSSPPHAIAVGPIALAPPLIMGAGCNPQP